MPFKEFLNKGSDALASEVLRELPRQVTNYYSMKGITPKKEVKVDVDRFMGVKNFLGDNMMNMIGNKGGNNLNNGNGNNQGPPAPPQQGNGGNGNYNYM